MKTDLQGKVQRWRVLSFALLFVLALILALLWAERGRHAELQRVELALLSQAHSKQQEINELDDIIIELCRAVNYQENVLRLEVPQMQLRWAPDFRVCQ